MTKASTDTSQNSRELMGWLWRNYLSKHIWLLLLAVVFMVIEGSMMGALSWIMKPMFDEVFLKGDQDALWFVGFVVLGVFIVRAFSSIAQKVLLTRITQRTAAEIRTSMLDRLMLQDNAYHKTHPPGFLIQRVQTDVESINQVWRAIVLGAGRDAVALFVLIGVAVSIDWRWALVAGIGTPILVLPSLVVQRFVRRRAREAKDLGATLATRLDEVFHGIVPIKLNRLEKYQSNRYRDLTKTLVRTEVRAATGTATIPGMIDIMSGLGFLGVLVYGGGEIISGEKTVGEFMTFFTAMGLAFEPARRLGNISGLWQVAAAGIERIKVILEAEPTLKSPAKPKAAPKGVPSVELSDVELSYGDSKVLCGASFTAEAGKTTAIVGASGAGKSTVFNVLTRLVDPDSGKVRIGGVEARDMALGDLRDLFSVVSQDALLFDETLRENIVLDRADVSDADLRRAMDAAHVSDFVDKLPAGLETRVGPRGSSLSGGQRQRVVIARAVLRDTPLLLLDEATSALDAQSETVVQKALDSLSKGRTTLVIAHRLSTVREADKIVVMDRGRVVDQGTHDELLERGGIYADLYRLQFSDDGPTAEEQVSRRALARDGSKDIPHQEKSFVGRILSWLPRL